MVADMEVEKVLQVYDQLKADVAATKALLADEQLAALETQLGELKLQEKKLLEEQLELASSLSVESEVATKM
jgi:predicted metal-dependent TIM-barrel fold hydrolase